MQRVWISLQHKRLEYQYIEIDPYQKPKQLLDLNPRGLVPTLQHDDWSCYESNVLLEYLEEAFPGQQRLLPEGARERAHQRLWIDHINRNVVPGFYRLLQAQEEAKQVELAKEFNEAVRTPLSLETLQNDVDPAVKLNKLTAAADKDGPFFAGQQLTLVDVSVAPWLLRIRRVLKPYRGYPVPEGRLGRWLEALETDQGVAGTLSGDELYLDSYERYAENRPGTSEVAKAVNEGRGLP